MISEILLRKEIRQWYNNLSQLEKDRITNSILKGGIRGKGIIMYLEDLYSASK